MQPWKKWAPVRRPSGLRSGFEEKLAAQMKALGLDYQYEKTKLAYLPEQKPRLYTPDFSLTKRDGSDLIIEGKGRWLVDDRMKMRLVLQQHPDLDIRIVFQNAHTPINKGSKTTYAMYADKILLPWAHRSIPAAWLAECV